jgi:dTDP-4-dehydrorhamnose reductase
VSSAVGSVGADVSTTALTIGFGSHMTGIERPETPRPVLVTGARGTLARALARACAERGLSCVALERAELDAADAASVERAMHAHRPWAVINAAGYVRVDDAEREREACWRENVVAPETLARACAAHGARLVTYSTDLVFDGALERERRAYAEHDAVAPLNVYGASKAEAETRVQAILPDALVLRTSAFFGPWDEWNFLTIALRELSAGRSFSALADVTVSPTYVPDLAHATLDLLVDGATGCGIWPARGRSPGTTSHASAPSGPGWTCADSWRSRSPRRGSWRHAPAGPCSAAPAASSSAPLRTRFAIM